MIVKYGADIDKKAIAFNLKKLINQTYKLLPNWEEDIDWRKPLETILEEFAGMDKMLIGQHELLFSIMCKLEGLFDCSEEDFMLFRRTIFEVLGLIGSLRDNVCQN